MIRKAKCRRKGKFAILHLVRIIESLVTVFSLGYLRADWYSNLLFSEWAEDIDCGYIDVTNRDGETKESTDVVSESDRLVWLCTSFSIFKNKTEKN